MTARFFEVNKELFLCLLVVFHVVASNAFALKETAFGRFDLSASLSAEYDSRVFGISSQSLQAVRTSGMAGVVPGEIESEDDLILKFTPAIHYTKKLRWFTFSGSAGVQLAQFVKNDKKSYIQPTSTFSIDFDESLKKRISNNAKIRFDMNFDLGQKVETSVLEQDLVSYSYFLVAANVRYNHSSKFGLGAGTSYTYRDYQDWATGGQTNSAYSDLATIPIYARAFYIYSEKLDFFTEYNFSRSRDMSGGGGSSLTDGATHGVSFGAQGELSPKLSGNANIGYVRQVYDDASFSGQSTLSLGSGLQWSLNRKTSMGFDLNRGFSPSAQGYTMLNTTGRVSLNHRFTDDVSGTAYVSYGTTDYTYDTSGATSSTSSNSLDNIGFGTNVTKTLSKHFTTSGGYSFSHIARDSESYGRHLVRVDLNGRF
ncbi:outer membrane beta-barrel protein [Opitutales bacterium]|nr:outer membrane beta-barrel protein [Opitutales bacterium]